jgi:toxin-antitoxin system PIN domain toxin
MIAVDTNILVYAHRRDAPFHEPAAKSMRALAEARDPWTIPWPCIHEFLAIVTHPRIYSPPSTMRQALDQIQVWSQSPSLLLLSEDGDYLETLTGLLTSGRISGPAVHDARVAALCLRNRVEVLWTADRDFGRFPALRVANPLISRVQDR